MHPFDQYLLFLLSEAGEEGIKNEEGIRSGQQHTQGTGKHLS